MKQRRVPVSRQSLIAFSEKLLAQKAAKPKREHEARAPAQDRPTDPAGWAYVPTDKMGRYGEEVYLPGDGLALVVVKGPAMVRPDGVIERELRTVATPARDIFGAKTQSEPQEAPERPSVPLFEASPGVTAHVPVSECAPVKNEASGTNSNHSRLDDTELQTLWRAGKDVRQIASLAGCSKSTVARRLAGQGRLL